MHRARDLAERQPVTEAPREKLLGRLDEFYVTRSGRAPLPPARRLGEPQPAHHGFPEQAAERFLDEQPVGDPGLHGPQEQPMEQVRLRLERPVADREAHS